MRKLTVPLLGLGGVLCVSTAVLAQAAGPVHTSSATSVEHFKQLMPRSVVRAKDGRISRIAGSAFAHGATARDCAEQFCDDHIAMFGIDSADLQVNPMDGRLEQPLMYDAATGTYKFTMIAYRHVKSGVPVYRSQLKVLMRNEAQFPMVLASSSLRSLGAFEVPADPGKFVDGARIGNRIKAVLGDDTFAAAPELVIWVGTDEEPAAPRLATRSIVTMRADKREVISDAATGRVLHHESIIHRGETVSGTVTGLSTEGIGSEQCEDEVPFPMPYLRVTSGLNATTTDANGDFTITPSGGFPGSVNATLDGEWFDVTDFSGFNTVASAGPTEPVNIEFNTANGESTRAQVNGYVHSNIVRDLVVQFNPSYPTVNNNDFPVTVNRTDFFCPGNAWYDPDDVTINFCESASSNPNTAWSSVIYHEYGHHLVNAGGSGQGQYGEGMGDVMSLVILDSPLLGLGFFNNCSDELRNADNTLQYPCNGEIHFCGQLIAGCIWDARNALAVTNPSDYLDILANLSVNSILVHTGNTIDPDITIDFLTLDDDDADIINGTPHAGGILAGFGAHNMVDLIEISYPDGFPEFVSPAGGTIMRVSVDPITVQGLPGTAQFFVDTGSGFVEEMINEITDNQYEAVFPASTCGETVDFYVTAEAVAGGMIFSPGNAPTQFFTSTSSDGIANTPFDDDFESNLGWTVTNSPGLADGAWGIGVPIGGGDRGDPPTDFDGSSQCFLTDNVDGNSDVDDGTTTLTSPEMDASSGTLFISYARWYSNSNGNAPFQDIMVVEASDDAGTTWVNVETIGPNGPDVSGGWVTRQFLVSNIVNQTDKFQIRFVVSDTNPQSVVEAGIDAVRLLEFDCSEPDCASDVNIDGNVDVDDLIGVILDWGLTSSPADINNDDIVDVDDLVAVILAWGPCP